MTKLNADSSHASQPDPPAQQRVQIPITWDGQKGFDPDNNDCTQAISDVIELMLNELWLNYSEIPENVQKRWFEKWAEGFTWPTAESKQIRKAFDYRAGRRYQQIMRDLRGGELQRLKWMSETLRKQLLDRFANDPRFKKRQASSKASRASSKGGCLHTGGSATIPKTRAKMTRSLERPATDAEVFRATHTRKRDKSIVEKHANDLLTEFSANLELCLSHARTGFTGSVNFSPHHSADSAMEVHPPLPPALTQARLLRRLWTCRSRSKTFRRSLQTQGHMLQQHIDEVRTLKDILAERDVQAEEHLKRMVEMQRQMAAFYDPLRPGSSAAAGGSGSSTALPLPPRPPPRHPAPEDGDDDDDYEDA
ncbi:hypothetical protein PIB30_077381 [Stylosanthes scabra]|uniref:Uncharacterized protein n=1 Tax=Stylosanthes scabra TaxID=79078 RepID=A0ABU6TQ26_9FABA|nr:hypothetical protein [Stylosanthes scabra]